MWREDVTCMWHTHLCHVLGRVSISCMGKALQFFQVLEKTIENSQGFKGGIKKNKEKKIEWIFFYKYYRDYC